MKKIIFSTLFLLSSTNVYSYPHFIAHGYNSCITCHYNPFGNGPINDYGRAVSGTAISSRGFYNDNKPEELIAKESGFFGKENGNKHIRPFVGYRGMFIKTNVGEANSESDFINMQLDANLVLKFGEKDQYISSISFGYAPIPRSLKKTEAGDKIEQYRTREHYIGYRPIPELGFYAGLLDKPFGIRVVEHNSFSRIVPGLTMNDQSHGLLVHYTTPSFEIGGNYFIGNLANEKEIQLKGMSIVFEKTVAEKNRLGFSFMSSKNEYLKLNAIAFHARSMITHGTSVLFELGKVSKAPMTTLEEKNEYYSLLQNHLRTNRGIYILNSIEYYKSSLDNNYRVRFGPGVQYYPANKYELRLDLYNTRNFNQETSSKDRWDLLAQMHLWF